jgi:ribonuclease R
MKNNNHRKAEEITSPILSLKITSVDGDGFATGNILDSKYDFRKVEIPFSIEHIKFDIQDHLLVQFKISKNNFEFIKIIKKLDVERRSFFAKVNVNPKNQLILQELERGRKSKDIIIPIIPKETILQVGDIVKAQTASAQTLKNIKIKKIKEKKRKRDRNNSQTNYAEIIEIIGSSLDPKSFSLLAIKENDLNYEFNKNVINEVKDLDKINFEDHKDLRSTSFVTIDGENAKDFDDAVYAEKLSNNKGWKILVAIADVSHYVKPNSYLDQEARDRGNSVYLPNLVIPMLPEKLSNNLCSLKPNLDRLCLTVEIILNNKGTKQSHKFFQSIINSKQRLTYEQVEGVIDNNISKDLDINILKVINCLHEVYKLLDNKRTIRGALNLNLPEKVIIFDKKKWPVNVKKVYGMTSNKIIEEFMILANVAAAEEINKSLQNSVYRVHEQPSEEKYKTLIDVIGQPLANILIGKVPRPSLMNKILEQTKETADYESINQSILRSQSQARYDNKNYSHFGLALKDYVHFTSPIRRYADLLIHRQIIEIINNKDSNKVNKKTDEKEIQLLCEHISSTERKAINAERKTIDRLITLLYQDRVNETMTSSIISVHKFGIFVSIDDGLAEALLPIRELPYDWYDYDQIKQILLGKNSGYLFKIGMELNVKITEVIPLTGTITVKFVSGGTKSKVKIFKKRRKK